METQHAYEVQDPGRLLTPTNGFGPSNALHTGLTENSTDAGVSMGMFAEVQTAFHCQLLSLCLLPVSLFR